MLKRIALKISVLCCALLIATAVTAAPRHASNDDARRAASDVSRPKAPVNSLSLQRLLSQRFRLTLDVFRSLRALDEPTPVDSGIGKLTIVDEPDPFASGGQEQKEPGEESDDSDERHRQQDERDGANPNTKPYQSMR